MFRFTQILSFILIAFASDVFSQSNVSSPYSRFGIGNLSGNISTEQSAMGGSYVAFSSDNSINFNNPATYSSLKPKSLLFSTSLITQGNEISTNQLNQKTINTHFSQISISMPLNKKIFLSSGLLPYSSMGYILDDSEEDQDLGIIDYNYTGEGGFNNYYVGTSMKLHKNFSIGMNASYLFGGISRNKTIEFQDPTIFNIDIEDRINVSGFAFKTGFIFNRDLAEGKKISLAATFQDNSNLQAKRKFLGRTYEINNSSLFFKDTFQNNIDTGSMTLPSEISAGFLYDNTKWLFVANYTMQNWQNYRMEYNNEIESDSLNHSICLSAGIQYTPNYTSPNRYWKTISYRLGARFNKSYLTIIDNPLQERVLTFGLGIPVKKSNTFYNLSLDIGERGLTNNNLFFFSTNTNYKLIKERFIRLSIGITFKGIWFVKRKYD